jgi:hypothetical protein
MTEEDKDNPQTPRSGLRGFARRMLRESEDDERRIDPRELLGAVLDTGDKARTEIVRLLAREVRGYVEALELHKDLRHILTNYSLDIRTNLSLRPLADVVDPKGRDESPAFSVRLRSGGDKAAEE